MTESTKVVYFVPKTCTAYTRRPKQKLEIISTNFNSDEDIIIMDKAVRLDGAYALGRTEVVKYGNSIILGEFFKDHIQVIFDKNYKKLAFNDEDVCLIKVRGSMWNKKDDLKKYILAHKQDWISAKTLKRKEDNMQKVESVTKFMALVDIVIGDKKIDKFNMFEVDEHQTDREGILIDGAWYELEKEIVLVSDYVVKVESVTKMSMLKGIENLDGVLRKIVYKGGEERTIIPLEYIEDENGDKVRAFQLGGDSNSSEKMGMKTFFIDYITIVK